MIPRSASLIITAAAACWVSLMGCGKDDGQRLEYELFENTKELDADTLAALTSVSEDQATLTFSGATELLDELEPPNILLSGASAKTPHGLLRRVTSVDRSGDEVIVQTEPSTVFHAFRRLDVAFESVVGDETATLRPPPTPSGPGTVAGLSVEFPLGRDQRAGHALRRRRTCGIEGGSDRRYDDHAGQSEDRLLAPVRLGNAQLRGGLGRARGCARPARGPCGCVYGRPADHR